MLGQPHIALENEGYAGLDHIGAFLSRDRYLRRQPVMRDCLVVVQKDQRVGVGCQGVVQSPVPDSDRPGAGWTQISPRPASRVRQVFRVANGVLFCV